MRTWASYRISLLLLALLAGGPMVLAQSGGGYDLSWHTVDGGGGEMSGGGYAIHGTLGQADAAALTSRDYTVLGGFWGRPGAALLLNGRVTLQGQGAQVGTLVQANEYLTATQADGAFSVSVPPGLYSVTASRPRFLSRQTVVVLDTDSVELAPVVLLAGDANEDGQIGLFDLVLIAVHYGTTPPGDVRADINDDGQVNLFDLVVVASNYGLLSPQPWLGVVQTEFEGGTSDKRALESIMLEWPDKVEAGQTVLAQVEWSADWPVNALDLRLRYDPAQLTLLAAGDKGQAAGEPGNVFDPAARFIARNQFDAATGAVHYTVVGLGQMRQTAERGILLTLHFRARVSGQPRVVVEAADWLASRGP